MQPKLENTKDTKIHLFGYWIDERGIKHKGRIPERNRQPVITKWATESYAGINGRTSTPNH